MPGFLRQSTASQSRALGPFVDDTDFKTAETALTIANTDIKLVVNGGAAVNKNSGGGTHRINGVYGVTFDATDTATVGELEVSVVVAGALPVFDKFTIIEEAIYDLYYAAGATGAVTVAAMSTGVITASVFAVNAVDAAALAADAVNEIADGLLDRNMATGTDSGSPTVRTMRQALRFLRNKWSISGTTLTVTKEDDVTASWTGTVTTDVSALPVTGNDPAG